MKLFESVLTIIKIALIYEPMSLHTLTLSTDFYTKYIEDLEKTME